MAALDALDSRRLVYARLPKAGANPGACLPMTCGCAALATRRSHLIVMREPGTSGPTRSSTMLSGVTLTVSISTMTSP